MDEVVHESASASGVTSKKPPKNEQTSEAKLSSATHDWVADGKNTILILNTVKLYTSGKSRASVGGNVDPYMAVTTSACEDFSFRSPVRKNFFKTPQWAVRVPLLVRPNDDDIITIQVWDQDVLTADDKLVEVQLSTHRLLKQHEAATAAKKQLLEMEGTVSGEGGDKEVRMVITTEIQLWDDDYKVHSGEAKSPEWDTYTRLLVTATRFTAAKFMDDGVVDAKSIAPPQQHGEDVETISILDGGAEVLAEDVQVPIGNASPMFFRFLNSMPFETTASESEYFSDRPTAEAYVQKLLGASYATLVSTEGSWGNVASDESFTRFMFSNNGSSFLHKTSDGYEARLDFMRKYDVRPGFERYGSTAFFDKDAKPIKIDVGGEVTAAGDDGWEWAKLQARSSAFVACSGVHLILAHYMWASIPNVAMTKFVKPDHPIRRLMHVHFFRSANTCLNSLDTLIPERGLVHRATAFEYAGLTSLFADSLQAFKFETFEEELKGRGHVKNDAHYPMLEDGLEYWQVLHRYVDKYIRLYYHKDQEIKDDAEWQAMTKYMAKYHHGLPEADTIDVTVKVLTECIFRVTGYHQHVGNVNISGTSPVMISDHLVKGQNLAAVESCTILAVITALTAGMLNKLGAEQYPGITEDWSQLLLDLPSKRIFNGFQADLKKLEKAIDKRNSKRAYVLNDFNPRFVKVSVSS